MRRHIVTQGHLSRIPVEYIFFAYPVLTQLTFITIATTAASIIINNIMSNENIA